MQGLQWRRERRGRHAGCCVCPVDSLRLNSACATSPRLGLLPSLPFPSAHLVVSHLLSPCPLRPQMLDVTCIRGYAEAPQENGQKRASLGEKEDKKKEEKDKKEEQDKKEEKDKKEEQSLSSCRSCLMTSQVGLV